MDDKITIYKNTFAMLFCRHKWSLINEHEFNTMRMDSRGYLGYTLLSIECVKCDKWQLRVKNTLDSKFMDKL